MLDILDKIEARLVELDKELIDPQNLSDRKKQIELNRERRNIEEILEAGRKYREIMNVIKDAREIIREGGDEEMVAMAREELEENEARVEEAEFEFRLRLLPRDPNDDKAAVVEIRAGTGGDEAGLFVADVFRMYQRFAEQNRWKLELLGSNESLGGGFKEIIFYTRNGRAA